MLESSLPQNEPLVEICAWCREDGTVAEPEGANVSHGLCPLHAELWALQDGFRPWNPAKWEACPARASFTGRPSEANLPSHEVSYGQTGAIR